MAAPAKKEAPAFTLPKEMQERMTKGKEDIDKAQKAIDVMKTLGMDVKEIQEKLDWVKNVRETLLKEFSE